METQSCIEIRRSRYGYIQTSQYVNPDLYHEEVDEIDAASLWSPKFETGTEMFSYLVLGDQNAGKSTFLHALTNDSSRNFLHVVNYYPMLSSSFINSRLIASQGRPIDEYPFLDTDLARASTLLSADAFQFFCKEQGLPWSREAWLLTPSTKFVGMTFVEVGGDHLDRMMLFYASQSMLFSPARANTEESATSTSRKGLPPYQFLWMAKFTPASAEGAASSASNEASMHTHLLAQLRSDVPERLTESVFNTVLRKSIGLVKQSPHSAYFVKLESLLEWDPTYLVEWLRAYSSHKAAQSSQTTGEVVSIDAQVSATARPQREQRARRKPTGQEVKTNTHPAEVSASTLVSASPGSTIPNARINYASLYTLVSRTCFLAQVASEARNNDSGIVPQRSISLLLTRSPIFTHDSSTAPGQSPTLPVSESLMAIWTNLAGVAPSKMTATEPDADVPRPPADPVIHIDLVDLFDKVQHLLTTLSTDSATPRLVRTFKWFSNLVLDVDADPAAVLELRDDIPAQWLHAGAQVLRESTALRQGSHAAPLTIALAVVLQAVLLCTGARSLMIADARYADHVVGVPLQSLDFKDQEVSPELAHAVAYAVQLPGQKNSSRPDQSDQGGFGQTFEQHPAALIKTIRELLVMQQNGIRTGLLSASNRIPLDHVATAMLQCFLQTSERFDEDGTFSPYIQQEHFCDFLANNHGGHSHGGADHDHDHDHNHDHDHLPDKSRSDVVKCQKHAPVFSSGQDDCDPWAADDEVVNVDSGATLPEAVMLRLFPDAAAALVRGRGAILHCHDCFSNLRVVFYSPSLGVYAWHPLLTPRPRDSTCTLSEALSESYAHEWSQRDLFTPSKATCDAAQAFMEAKDSDLIRYSPKARLLWEKAIIASSIDDFRQATSIFTHSAPSSIAIRFPFSPTTLLERYAIADRAVNAEIWSTSQSRDADAPILTLSHSDWPENSAAEAELLARAGFQWSQLCQTPTESTEAIQSEIRKRGTMLFIWTLEEYNLVSRQRIEPSDKTPALATLQFDSTNTHEMGLKLLNAIQITVPADHITHEQICEWLKETGVDIVIHLS